MPHVAFDLVRGSSGAAVEIRIGRRRLQDLAQEVEAPLALAEGSPGLAGSYGPLATATIAGGPPSRWQDHFRGRPQATWFGDGDTVLLGCGGCGEWGCWPLCAQVDVGDRTVTWSRFRNGHRGWDLSALGPFAFDRHHYERALGLGPADRV